MTLTVLLGDYGSGKTTTAKYLAKQTNGIYIDVDQLSKNNNITGNTSLIDKLRVIIKSGSSDYYMDGHPAGYGYGVINHDELGTDIKYIACMASPKIIQRRQVKKAGQAETTLPRTIDDIMRITTYAACVALTYDNNPLFADTTTQPPTLWRKDNWIKIWMEINLYASLDGAGEYQDVELGERTIVGLSKSYKTWDRLKAMINFKDKSVIDYGCNYGYFCFKVEEAGASSIIGVDESKTVLNMAINIGMTKASRAVFLNSELKYFKPPDTDIIMALNVMHHLNYDRDVLGRMFSYAGMVVMEMPFKDLSLIDDAARANKFSQLVIASSHRDGRCIAIYSKAKPVVLPRKFVYHPRRVAVTKWLYHKIIPVTNFGIARIIKRYLWMRLK